MSRSQSGSATGDYDTRRSPTNYSRPNYTQDPPRINSRSPDSSSPADPLRTQYSDYDTYTNPEPRREAYLDADLAMRKYQGLSASSVQGYQAVRAGDVSEPASPTMQEPYEPSNESGSGSSGKHDQHLGNPHHHPSRDTMSSDGSYENRNHAVRSISWCHEVVADADFIPVGQFGTYLRQQSILQRWRRLRRSFPVQQHLAQLYVWSLSRRIVRTRFRNRIWSSLHHRYRSQSFQHSLQLVSRRA